jgi:hypothetical protein
MKRAIVIALGFVLAVSIAASAQSTPTPQAPKTGAAFVDANGDGICDNYQGGTPGAGKGYGQGRGRGQHLGPRDGSGFGAGSGAGTGTGTGTGTCDGTGPKGRQMGRGRR